MKSTAFFSLFLSLLLSASLVVSAQQLMTLDDALSIGLKNNYDILMARNQEEAAALDYRYAFGAFLPDISANASRIWSTANINQKYSNGNKVKRDRSRSNNISLSADLNWTLFDGLKVFATKDKLKAIEEAGTLTVKAQIVASVGQIMVAYYNIVQAEEQLQSIQEQMGISEERVNIAKNKYTSGLGSKIDLLQARVDLNAQKSAYLQQQAVIDENKAVLNQLIALAPDNAYTVSDTIPVNMALNFDSLRQQALAGNPSLLLAQKNIDISRLSLKEIQRSRFPTIAFQSSYAYSKQSSEAGFSLFNENKGLSYGFTASVPVFQGFNLTRQAKTAELGIAYQQLDFSNQKSQVSLELQNNFRNYAYYKKAIGLEEQNLQVAEENVQVTLASFKLGQVSSLEVKEAQQSLADARFRLISARYNAKLSEINLLQLKGRLLQ